MYINFITAFKRSLFIYAQNFWNAQLTRQVITVSTVNYITVQQVIFEAENFQGYCSKIHFTN